MTGYRETVFEKEARRWVADHFARITVASVDEPEEDIMRMLRAAYEFGAMKGREAGPTIVTVPSSAESPPM